MGLIQYQDIGHADAFIFDDFVIKQIKQGIVVSETHKEELKTFVKTYFKDKNFAYISNRVISYSVDPMIYKDVVKIPNLVAIAVVTENEIMRTNAEYEKQFYNKPYGVFDNLSDAIKWVRSIIEKENKKTQLN